ncbi:MAG: hypothetical protein IAE80_22910, partial [Anaerolinea sp.]|nr:hypothetical protein [Anaerolinea sp.]
MSNTSSLQAPTLRGQIQAILARIERIHPSLSGEDAITSGLLARMLLVSFAVGALLIGIILGSSPDQIRILDTQMILIGWLTLPLYFVLNRRGHVHVARIAYVVTTIIAFAVPTYVDGASASSLGFTAISFLLAGIFFSGNGFIVTIVLTSLWIGLMILINQANPASAVYTALVNYLASWSFLILMGALVITFVSHLRSVEGRRRHELEMANAGLRESERLLEQRVDERTRELVAAKEEAESARIRAEQADLVKSQFLASMSHELRTPLNSILNFSEFLNMGVLGDVTDDQRGALTNITESGNHLLALINDVLDISKIQSGALKLVTDKDIDLNKEINSVIETTRTLIGDHPVTLTVDIAPDLPRIDGDKRRIRQIWLNLLSNAAKFTEEGSITFRAVRCDTEVEFTVIDTGPGIKESEQANLFEPF